MKSSKFILLLLLYSSSNAFLFSASSSFPSQPIKKNCNRRCHPYYQRYTHLSFLSNVPIDTITDSSSSSSSSSLQSKRERIKSTTTICKYKRQHYNLTILLPAYNELNRIGDTLYTYIRYMKCHPVYQFPYNNSNNNNDAASSLEQQSTILRTTGECSFLVVDDGSTDGNLSEFIRQQSWFIPTNITTTTTSSNDDENSITNGNNDFKKQDNVWKVNEHVKCITLPYNQGKGAAVARGMMELDTPRQQQQQQTNNNNGTTTTTTRSLVLVADADGSANISSIDDMLYSLECLLLQSSSSNNIINNSARRRRSEQEQVVDEGMAIIVGKRQYPQSKQKSVLRSILSWGFKTCVSILFIGASTTTTINNNNNDNNNKNNIKNIGSNNNNNNNNNNALGVSDTQCGFKLMTTQTGKLLYHNLNLNRWSHDVEVVYRASCCLYEDIDIAVGECPVDWVDKDGSKLVSSGRDAVVMSGVMLGEIGWMRIMYALGKWRIGSSDDDG